ncbi:hypothetical protein HG536_0A05030 [Torulaspora globosa]|uniref:Sensitive to high expression protein 9, mitochondrial n=1 Tax=Torulaspora globosa TaxID=48254 RepID=A0A7G3ZB02_9SACH|nr:uncharacterized protein HG536_0A05030 [Torulaspora globosa]QLL30688.1 hypothetical protein HG536_0A05030 [Torulaspora globosa]
MIQRWQRPAFRVGETLLYQRWGLVVNLRHASGGPLHQKKALPEAKKSKVTGNLWEPLGTHWKKVKGQLKDTRSILSRHVSQFSYHVAKARMSIMEANKKLAEQEQEGADQRLTYDRDMETSETIRDLPSQRELHRRRWSRKLEFYFDSLQETIFTATRALNDVTGYSSIERLRKSIEIMENNMEDCRETLRNLKDKYATAIEERKQSQKQLNELLQRKSTWSPADLERFTQIYKDDALNQKREQALKLEVSAKETQQEKLSDDLYRAILTRYHEEQIWSDKIRRTSTWGTFILMGVNIILFLVFQLLLEPWKRRRLTRSFEDKVKNALDDYAARQDMKLEQLRANIAQPAAISTILDEQIDRAQADDASTEELTATASSSEPAQEVTAAYNLEDEISERRSLVRRLRMWIQDLLYKFCPPAISHVHSKTILSNLELYVYSTLLILLGALSARFMP